MLALITGASSGIGREAAKILAHRGYSLILVARRLDRLEELAADILEVCDVDVSIVDCDLSDEKNCYRLYKSVEHEKVDLLVNNAGFGTFGEFTKTDLKTETQMIDLNCKAVHILTKLFLKDMTERNSGYILNVASSAGLMKGGPFMAAYYATKSYVVNLTRAINEELLEQGSNVYVGALCPGPVDTEFNEVAGVHFGLKGMSAKKCAIEGLYNALEKRKMIIVPTLEMKLLSAAAQIVPSRILLAISSGIQSKKS
ncbi:MAG: SDR family oxidoreductase [Ruminococcus sp.]|nr:SDR family oxidoreductase [Ruminococcus sp.]